MPEWPPHVEYAIREMAYEYPGEEIAAFINRWGGLEKNNFIHALQEGQEDDRLLAFLVSEIRYRSWQVLLAMGLFVHIKEILLYFRRR